MKLSVQLPEGLEEVGFQSKEAGRDAGGTRCHLTRQSLAVHIHLSIHCQHPANSHLPTTQLPTSALDRRAQSDEPAPSLTIKAASESPTPTTTETDENEDDDDTRDNLALGFGIAGLVAGLLALGLTLVQRRSTGAE